MTRAEVLQKIDEELAQAGVVLREGKESRARANARRTVGHALAWWLMIERSCRALVTGLSAW
ncbi:MAG: hypothetical protein HY784_12855 [Chloroflexi bacterium]|nr:hypothetical protein [Chloroflexota bacterium]